MSEFQLVVCNRQGVPIDELPDATLEKLTWKLTDMGEATVTLKNDDSRVATPLLLENELQVYISSWPNQTDCPWWGVFWRCRNSARQAVFELQTLESYFTKSFIDTASLYWDDGAGNDVATEQLSIAWALVNYAQTGTNRTRYITQATYSASGKTRFRRYLRSEHPNILEALREFPGLLDGATGTPNGFDWEIKGYRDGRREWTPYYPTRGSLKSSLMLEYGKNLLDFDVDEDAVVMATKTYNTGGSDGDIKIEANYEDTVASAKYGQQTAIISTSEQKDPTTLTDIARSYTGARNKPVITPSLNAVRVPEELLGTLMPGDTVPISIHRGRINIEDTMRISAVTWYPGKKELGLEFIPRLS